MDASPQHDVPPIRQPADGNGGFAVVETDNPMDLAEGASKFGFAMEYQIYPVVDVAEGVPSVQEGVEFRESIG